MAESIAQLLPGIAITLSLLAVICVAGFLIADSRSTRAKSARPAPAPTPPSESRLAKLESEMVELWSIVEKNTSAMSKLTSRLARRAERAPDDPPPVGASKSELRKYYGLDGKTPADVVSLHQPK